MKVKTKTNFIIDVVMFLVMMLLTGTGLLRKYILLSGQQSKALYGQKVEQIFLGVTRDGWSDIHLYLGYLLLALLVLHIVLHWSTVKVMYRQLIQNSTTRLVLALVFVLLSLAFALFPFFITVQVL